MVNSSQLKISAITSFLLIGLWSPICAAESLPEMQKNDLLSVFSKENRAVLIYGAIATSVLAILEDQISDPAQNEIVEQKPLGKFSVLGDYSGQLIPNALYVIGMGGYGLISNDDLALSRTGIMVRATLSASVVSTALKVTLREPRPYDSKIKTSFPSGHSTTAFAFASVVGAEHNAWAGASAYALATLVAISRMNDNRHYLHDVVGGATIGLSYGLSIAKRAKAKISGSSHSASRLDHLVVLPTENLDGFAAATHFTF